MWKLRIRKTRRHRQLWGSLVSLNIRKLYWKWGKNSWWVLNCTKDSWRGSQGCACRRQNSPVNQDGARPWDRSAGPGEGSLELWDCGSQQELYFRQNQIRMLPGLLVELPPGTDTSPPHSKLLHSIKCPQGQTLSRQQMYQKVRSGRECATIAPCHSSVSLSPEEWHIWRTSHWPIAWVTSYRLHSDPEMPVNLQTLMTHMCYTGWEMNSVKIQRTEAQWYFRGPIFRHMPG